MSRVAVTSPFPVQGPTNQLTRQHPASGDHAISSAAASASNSLAPTEQCSRGTEEAARAAREVARETHPPPAERDVPARARAARRGPPVRARSGVAHWPSFPERQRVVGFPLLQSADRGLGLARRGGGDPRAYVPGGVVPGAPGPGAVAWLDDLWLGPAICVAVVVGRERERDPACAPPAVWLICPRGTLWWRWWGGRRRTLARKTSWRVLLYLSRDIFRNCAECMIDRL